MNNITNLKQDPTVTDTLQMYKVELVISREEVEDLLEAIEAEGFTTHLIWYPIST